MTTPRSAFFWFPVLLLSACSEAPRVVSKEEALPAATTASSKPAPPLPAGVDQTALPPSHPPIGGASAELVFKAPAGWAGEDPTMPMRRQQFRLQKQGSDTSDATVTVSVLPAREGGGVDVNLQRWAGQFKQPDGKASLDVMKRTDRKLGPHDVIEIDVSGTYVVDERAMGGARKYDEPGWRMLLSWIRAPGGNYYVKLVGPAATVAHWESSFRGFVDSAAP